MNTIKDYFFGIPLDDKLKSALDWLKSLRPQKLDASKLENFDPVDVLKRIKKEWPIAWEIVVGKQEWSEEDSDNLERVDNYLWMLDNYIGDDCATPQGKTDKIRGNIQEVLSPWLKSLPERFNLQPKQEWSEEDERMLKRIEAILLTADGDLSDKLNGKVSPITDSAYSSMKLCIAKCLSWLKSLRPSWKPSEEQMAALQIAAMASKTDFNTLTSLLVDLKKL